MGKKGGRGGERWQKKDNTKSPKIRTRDFNEEDMDDEIDTFHKQRDIVPLDLDEDIDSSDEDDVQAVFDIEGLDEDEDDEEEEDDRDDKYAAKIVKQQKILRRKTGGVEDETHDDSEADEVKEICPSGHGGDNVDFELESDDEGLAEEEAEVIRITKRTAELQSIEDFVAEDIDLEESSDGEKTIEHILHNKTRARSRPQDNKGAEDEAGAIYEVKKDLKALSREEQMDVVHSSAPELVGLLSELKDALHQLESKVNPLISKLKKRNGGSKEGMRYLETKHVLLLAYCQAISFYLLLKSEGHPVRDHPVIARLVEIKNLLDKMKELDEKLPSELEEILNQDHDTESEIKLSEKTLTSISETIGKDNRHSSVSTTKSQVALLQPHQTTELINGGFSQQNGKKQENGKKQIGLQSMEMLKVRARLEEKLKEKGLVRSRKIPSQSVNMNSRLETIDDFGDAVIDKEGGNSSSMRLSKVSKLNKFKVVSGDDDLPKRDDIGERRRKHELRVLANAGVEYNDEVGDEPKASDDEPEESEDELIKQAKRRKIVKLSEKAELYSRTSVAPSSAEPDIVDGKRQITRQILKNRGLTRQRNKLNKNPRRNYRKKHDKKNKAWQGASRPIRKPTGPSYDGERTGINPRVSRSTRFK
ncbi:hypothetical protein AQUCO_01700424v1 [Aquilegia coerulea]|uniref:Sas10 C-terminal domain-containing protein n=1 Tax=Aquilegia coerulea TaxID=218851 RepID=A0A2G5DMT8_AQUCA|nr:hypothetical protein AQUCO_01700424v1 [Aquilegia coerulea]PIA44812.1 hypothetical protein AQUCO_01700424v1 [Aquilegia coerulea]